MTGAWYLDVGTGAVVTAGRRTAATVDGWSSWGERSRIVFDTACQDTHSERIAQALGDYAAAAVSQATVVGQQVSALGVTTVTAGAVVEETDLTAAALLEGQGSTLARPVNTAPVDGARVAV